jgi:hypothetical protein
VKPFKSVDAPIIRYLSHDEITRLLNVCQRAFRDLVHARMQSAWSKAKAAKIVT